MFERNLPSQYDQFQSTVADISAGMGGIELVGEGAESKVWRARLALGDYAIKIAKENALNERGRVMGRALMTKSKIESGLMALGVNGLEQLETGSIEDYAAIFQFVDGIRLTNFTEEDIEMVTSEQKERFIETVAKTTERGLAFDGTNSSGANAFYNAEIGFTMIDYKRAWWPMEYEENWVYAIQSLGPLAVRLFNN